MQVEVWGEKELTTVDYISPSGKLLLPLIGEIQAAGMTTLELREDIQVQYAQDYLRNPIVTVTVVVAGKESTNPSFTVRLTV